MNKSVKALTVSDLEKNKDSSSVWVLNNSNPKGVINFVMNDGMGATQTIRVAVTFIPVDLSTQGSKSAIVLSPQFRRLVSMGMLKIIDGDVAEQMMLQPQFQKEAQRVGNMSQELTMDPTAIPSEVASVQAEGDGSVSGFTMNLAIAADLDEDQVMTSLMGNSSAMTLDDFKYLAERSVHPRVKAFCAEQIVNA
jgi:hypothetical protein